MYLRLHVLAVLVVLFSVAASVRDPWADPQAALAGAMLATPPLSAAQREALGRFGRVAALAVGWLARLKLTLLNGALFGPPAPPPAPPPRPPPLEELLAERAGWDASELDRVHAANVGSTVEEVLAAFLRPDPPPPPPPPPVTVWTSTA